MPPVRPTLNAVPLIVSLVTVLLTFLNVPPRWITKLRPPFAPMLNQPRFSMTALSRMPMYAHPDAPRNGLELPPPCQ